MGRRALLILSASIVLTLAVILYFTGKGRERLVTDPYTSIDDRACIVVETVDLLSFLNSITTGKGIFGELGRLEELSQFNTRLKYLADLLNKAELRDISAGHSLISFYPGKDKPGALLSMTVNRDIKGRHLKHLLASAGISNIAENIDGNTALYGIPYSRNTDTVFLSIRSGLLLAANSSEIIKTSLSALESKKDIRQSVSFSKILLATGNDDYKVFLVFDNLPGLLKPILSDELKSDGSALSKLASAGGGGLYIDDEGLILSGYTESPDSTHRIFRYKSVIPTEFGTYRILPAGTVLFETVFRQDGERSIDPDSGNVISILSSGMAEYLDDEITRAIISMNEGDASGNSVIIFELNNPVQAEQVFSGYLDESGIRWFQPDDQIKIPVYSIPSCGLANALYPGFAENYPDSLVAFYDRYMIAGSSFNTISRILYDNLLNSTLANDVVYRDFESSLPSRSGYFFYCVPSKILTYLEGFFSEKFISSIRNNRNSLNKVQAAGYQLASSNEMVYSSLSVRFKDQVREESLSEWETLLDTTAATKPFFFTNHITGAKEIFVQDLKNNIYLINTAGRVLWKAPLSERIQGSIYMIDFYRNGKYQLLFNGRNYLHLVDRNGNYVERFPVKLRSPATNSLALFDYDNNRNYRILISGEDRQIYAYDKSGNVVKGWKPFRTAGVVRAQLSYFRVSGKDYIAASDEASLYLLDRSGNRRVNFKEPVTRAAGSSLKLNSGSEQFLICSSNEGFIQHIYFDGSVKKIKVGNFSPAHSMDIFDIDADGIDEFIYIEQGKLYLYDHNLTELSSSDLGSVRLDGPFTFSFTSDDRKIGLFHPEKNLIYLIDKNGEIMDGFPLKGASMFSIGKLSDKDSWNLIVGGPDRFLYNYIIGNGK